MTLEAQIDGKNECDVCGKGGPIGVAASRLGPVSFAYCNICRDRDAEPLLMVATAIFHAGGRDANLPSGLSEISTFDASEYRDLSYVKDLYPALEGTIQREFFGI